MDKLPSLYKISDELSGLIELLNDEESYDENGELDPVVAERFSILQKDFETKAISCSYVLQMFGDRQDAIDKELERLTKLKKQAKKAQSTLEQYMLSTMNRLGIDEIKSDTRTLKISKSQAVDVFDIDQLPEEYQRTKIEVVPDKIKIKDDIKNGLIIPGAKMIENQKLRIK